MKNTFRTLTTLAVIIYALYCIKMMVSGKASIIEALIGAFVATLGSLVIGIVLLTDNKQ